MNRLPKNPDPFELSGCYIAGGAILSLVTKTEINDYDIYPKSLEDFGDILEFLTSECNCYIMNVSDRAVTLKSNDLVKTDGTRTIVQVMFFDWFDTSQKIFDKFDFTVCMAAFDCDTKTYEFHPDFYPDVASKTLRFNDNTSFPVASLIRTQKYNKKGYHLGKAEMLKMSLCVAKHGLPSSWKELEKQIGGTYGRQIKLDTKGLIYTYENAINLLSDINLNIYYVEDLSDSDPSFNEYVQDIINYFTNENKEYIIHDGIGLFVDGQKILNTFSNTLLEECGVPSNFKKSKNTKFFGYYLPSHYYYKKTPTGLVGTTLSNSIDIYKNKEEAIQNKKQHNPFLVSFDIDNIKITNYHKLWVSNAYVEKMVDDINIPMEDDIHDAIEARLLS